MLFIAISLCFLLACFIAWMILFGSGRDVVTGWVRYAAGKTKYRIQAWQRSRKQALGQAGSSLEGWWLRTWLGVRQHYWLCLAAVVLIALPPLGAILFSGKSMLQGFEDTGRVTNVQIAELLKGEQLVPPPPLPPDFFTTQEVQQVRPMLVGASRNWQLLNPDYVQRLLLVFKIMKEKYNYDMTILEGYRSPERQNMLAALGTNVTNAAAFQSYHQYGLAADCAFMRDGKLVISEKDPWAMEGYRRYGEVAESVGLTWGGRWKMMDFGHTELHLPGVLKKP
ncbi:MAG: M15 family metallopeptidase [Rhodoferax sp.]|uniref:M15 family metallopeptidase n=1 Tax=Rhodoferax sp. TaxID=50421 RepID=UPI0032637777